MFVRNTGTLTFKRKVIKCINDLLNKSVGWKHSSYNIQKKSAHIDNLDFFNTMSLACWVHGLTKKLTPTDTLVGLKSVAKQLPYLDRIDAMSLFPAHLKQLSIV